MNSRNKLCRKLKRPRIKTDYKQLYYALLMEMAAIQMKEFASNERRRMSPLAREYYEHHSDLEIVRLDEPPSEDFLRSWKAW